ncbi:MAG TPA: DinB family protein [Planctomycetota bacterium]|nr:DinB family protein [Planctomycetota bacterium]
MAPTPALVALLSAALLLQDGSAQSRPASAPADPEAKITSAERDKALDLQRKLEKETLAAVEGLSDAQWTWKPAPNKWSVGEVIEHLVLVETRVQGRLDKTLAGAPDPDWKKKTAGKAEMLEKLLPDRSMKADAPEPVQPKGKLTHAEAIAEYKKARAKTIEMTVKSDAPLKAFTFDHPFFGPLSAYQWLLLVPLHNQRHNQQIAEVKATAGFPSK